MFPKKEYILISYDQAFDNTVGEFKGQCVVWKHRISEEEKVLLEKYFLFDVVFVSMSSCTVSFIVKYWASVTGAYL